MDNPVEVVDLFCGVGGLTCGLQKAGLRVIAGIDNDKTVNTLTKKTISQNLSKQIYRDIQVKT